MQDVCDPEPTLRFGSVTSSQPDNGSGDGDTSGDVVEFPDHVCLRTERQGVAIAGRRYAIEVHAIDASGNAGDPTIEVEVPHDRGPDGCTPMRANEFADEGSERCTVAERAPEAERLVPPTPTQLGCTIGAPGAALPLLALALNAIGRRRRR